MAVAANFAAPLRALVAAWPQSAAVDLRISVGSTGALFGQIEHGAPFDLFLAADADRPERLEQAGLTVPGSRAAYAIGRLALYAPGAQNGVTLEALDQVLGKVAIANPATAPYGKAAQEFLQATGRWSALEQRLVIGQSIGQTFQFCQSGSVAAGLVAAAQVQDLAEQWVVVPARHHEPIVQQLVVLQDRPTVRALARWLLTDNQARALIAASGYDLPTH